MKEETLHYKFVNAAKWSTLTEIAARLVSPVTNMILARLIAPEAFGVVATVTMIVSFADLFTDAGFQKYLVQHEFKKEDEKFIYADVAFWTNFGMSTFLWLIILVFREKIAVFIGNPGLGKAIAIASLQLLLTSFSSIQMALYRRDFDFRTLFFVRMVSVCQPFVVIIPLALLGLSYWALIVGAIFTQLSNAIILTVKSKWKPHFNYKVEILKEMLSFSIWSLIEAISIWLTAWADVFIISNVLDHYYLGIYKTSTTLVNALMSMLTASIVPVLFSVLSRLQDDPEKFNKVYFTTQKLVSIFVFPLGIGVYLYRDLATRLLLGSQWEEASGVIGVWALTSAIMIVFGYFCSEVYRAKGRPKLSFLAQLLHLVVLVPVCIVSSKYGFWPLVYARAWIRMESLLVDFIIMKFAIGIPIEKTVKNVIPTVVTAFLMGALGYLLQHFSKSLLWSFSSIVLCSSFYFGVLYLFPSMRKDMNEVIQRLKSGFSSDKYIAVNGRRTNCD